MHLPEDLKYTKDHEWTKIDGSVALVGITDHAQNSLGDIVFVDLPEVGRDVKAGDTFGVVESIKAVSDLYAPISGKVVEVHQALSDEPGRINSHPYESWIVKIETSSPIDQDQLLDSQSYETFVNSLN